MHSYGRCINKRVNCIGLQAQCSRGIGVVQTQRGSGLIDDVRKVINKGVSIGKAIDRFAAGNVGTAIKNLIPSSDANARPSFVGERHPPMRLDNGKFGIGNYMGPGTQLVKRIRRGDPPRNMVDRVAQAHDTRYALAKGQSDVVAADKLMIKKLKQMIKRKQGNSTNIAMGLAGIRGKMIAERSGIVQPGAIASFGGTAESDVPMLKAKLKELEQAGFGLLPGEKLKKEILRKLRREGCKSKMQGKGKKAKKMKKGGACKSPCSNKPLAKKLTSAVGRKIIPLIMKSMKGRGLKLAGSGAMKSGLYMQILKGLNDGSSSDRGLGKGYKVGSGQKASGLKLAGTGMNKKQVKLLSQATARGLMPILMSMSMKSQKGKGKVPFAELKKRAMNPTLLDKLSRKLFDIFAKKMSTLLKPKKKLQLGSGFFSDFGKGFMSVFKPAVSVLKTVAPILPLLL